MEGFSWIAPEFVWLGFAVALTAWVGLLAHRRRRAKLATEFGAQASRTVAPLDPRQHRLRSVTWILGSLLAVIALMRPAWGERSAVRALHGIDVVFCVDVSRSMLASDTPPNRLAAAKLAIDRAVRRAVDDRFALVAFAGEARLRIPLTGDAESFRHLASLVSEGSVRTGGTDLGAAIDLATRALQRSRPGAAIVLLTDGEDHRATGIDAANRAAESGLRVHAIGFGSERGSKIVVADGTAMRDRTGVDVITARDSTSLRAVTQSTGGEFFRAESTARALEAILERHVRPHARRVSEQTDDVEKPDRFQWPLLFAVLLWILELGSRERRR